MTWDYIIIGAGSSGCALAYELVRAGRSVLIIEAGGSDRSPFIKFPAGTRRAGAKFDWGYRSQPDPSRNGVTENWTRGRVLGGSSSINGMMYVRGTKEDYDRWDLPGWSAKAVMPIFREMECSDQLGPVRGQGGPLHVRTIRHPHGIVQAFAAAAHGAGFPYNPDYNGESQEGVAFAQLSQRRGFRCSAADAFLRPLLGRKNLKLLLDTLVEKINFENGRATSVTLMQQGRRRQELARDIVLCAGAINSPKLLMLSGIGDEEELSRLKIGVVRNLPAVGRHLKEHPLVTLGFRTKVPTNNLTEGLFQKLGFAAKFLWHGDGPIADLFECAVFARSTPAQANPDLQIVFMSKGFVKKPDGRFKLAPYPSVSVHIIESYPKSNGRIRLSSNDPNDPPLIESNLLENRADVDTLVNGIETLRKIMATEPMNGLIEEEITPGADIRSASELEDFVRARASISFHPIGTCRMGVGEGYVVDPEMRVYGTENLWIADASIVPQPLSANMNAPCIMIGLKLGKQLVRRDNATVGTE